MTGPSPTQPLTIAEKILSARSGGMARAGDIVICNVDCVLGTDGSGPMAIDYFERMAGATAAVVHPERVFFSLDHYAPPAAPQTVAFHERIRAFASAHGATVFAVGDGISHQLAAETGIVRAGDLVVGADSHTVMLGACNALAIGVGSSDLAAAMLTGQVWLRVPETIRVHLTGALTAGVAAKDLALAIVALLGSDGADYRCVEFGGQGVTSLRMDDRFVICSLMVEAGAKAAVFPYDAETAQYVAAQGGAVGKAGGRAVRDAVAADEGAQHSAELTVDLRRITPRVALPHAPDNVATLDAAAGTPVQMVFAGTCTGGRASDFHALRVGFDAAGGRIADGVQLVLTPASRQVFDELTADGTIAHLVAAGATLTTTGCGACCGTSGVVPTDGMTVISTANRNFKGRMGNATARIFLASPLACGMAAATGVIPAAGDLTAAGAS